MSYSYLFPALFRECFRPGEQVLQEVQAGIVHVLRNLGQQVLQAFIVLVLLVLTNGTGLSAVDGVNDMPVGTTNGKGANRSIGSGVANANAPVSIF